MVKIRPLKNRLRYLRVQVYDLTAEEFIKKFDLGVSVATYSSWELGKSYPHLRQAFDIAEKLGQPVTYLWYYDD